MAAHLNPSSPDPPYTLGILDMQRGLFDDAVASLKIALGLRSPPGAPGGAPRAVWDAKRLMDADEAVTKWATRVWTERSAPSGSCPRVVKEMPPVFLEINHGLEEP